MHRDNVTSIIFSRKSNFLMTGSADGHIKFWKKKDQGLASAAHAIPGNSTGSRQTQAAETIKAKAKVAQETGDDLTFLGESLEFVKQYRSHLMSVDYLTISRDETRAASICTGEMSLKIYDISNFDMISMFKFNHIRPIRCEFLYNSSNETKLLMAACQLTGRLEFIDTEYLRYESKVTKKLEDTDQNGEKFSEEFLKKSGLKNVDAPANDATNVHVADSDKPASADIETAPKSNPEEEIKLDHHNLPRFSKISKSVISCFLYHPDTDENMAILFHLDGTINFLDVLTRKLSTTKLKNHPDLYNLQKDKCFAVSCDINKDGTKFVVNCSDKTVRMFSYKTGKQLMKLNESIDSLRAIQEKSDNGCLDLMEFEQRVLTETRLDRELDVFIEKQQCPVINLCSSVKVYDIMEDELIIYPCIGLGEILCDKDFNFKPQGRKPHNGASPTMAQAT